ncbi:hypothetical protein [Roseovarius aestuarii]|uniref:Uncharacterized protein n=1 Tax=Roseovarius aestuarii TaxID=475083 RepID=A0A1X7BWD0_9RHOB|nr:hypothetical protein [Roseovarius aestuarii]SMC13948.1 hypothetical protein ROA7745_03810 [Roseovarius aestuarii]
MAERQMDTETMLGALNDIRLPAEAAGGQVAEMLVAAGAGLALAWLVALLVTASRRGVQATTPSLAVRIDALRELPAAERSVALLHLARDEGIALPAVASLYGAGEFPRPEEIEAQLRDGQGTHA